MIYISEALFPKTEKREGSSLHIAFILIVAIIRSYRIIYLKKKQSIRAIFHYELLIMYKNDILSLSLSFFLVTLPRKCGTQLNAHAQTVEIVLISDFPTSFPKSDVVGARYNNDRRNVTWAQ